MSAHEFEGVRVAADDAGDACHAHGVGLGHGDHAVEHDIAHGVEEAVELLRHELGEEVPECAPGHEVDAHRGFLEIQHVLPKDGLGEVPGCMRPEGVLRGPSRLCIVLSGGTEAVPGGPEMIRRPE